MKQLTEDGNTRKQRIIERLFFCSKKTKLILNFCLATLPFLKEYICLFEMKVSLIHKLHEKQFTLYKGFLTCFLKAEAVQGLKPKHDTAIIDDLSCLLPKREMFVGTTVKGLISSSHRSDSTISSFLEQVETAYVKCAKYLRTKLPLDDKVYGSDRPQSTWTLSYNKTSSATPSTGDKCAEH